MSKKKVETDSFKTAKNCLFFRFRLSPSHFQIFHLRELSRCDRCGDEGEEDSRDDGVVEVVLEKVEALGRGHARAVEIQAVNKDHRSRFKISRSSAGNLPTFLCIKIRKSTYTNIKEF